MKTDSNNTTLALIGKVKGLSKSETHTFQKFSSKSITLLKGLGVQGDAHMGTTVKHRSRVAHDPSQPNLRQVHLIHTELHEELKAKGFEVAAGDMGENITTEGLVLLDLPKGSILSIGTTAKVEVTGLRNPCKQLETIKKGLMKALLGKDSNGELIRKAGIMGIVLEGGVVQIGDEIQIELPEEPYIKLKKV